jgi:hypothetical protein
MVESVVSYRSHSNISAENEVNLNHFVCYKCSNYEEKLKEVIDELNSAETIIKILQKELHSTRTIENTCARNQIATEGPGRKPITKEWALITTKNNTEKPQMHDKRNKNKITTTDQPITTANRFTPLYNLEEDNTESNGYQNHEEQAQMHKIHKSMKQQAIGLKIPTIVNGHAQYTDNGKLLKSNNKSNHQIPTTNWVNKRKEYPKFPKHASQKQHKVMIVGDSQITKIQKFLWI